MTNYLFWWPVLLGWPAVLVALAVSGFGIFKKRPRCLYVAAFLILPFSLYLAATPRFGSAAMVLPLAVLLAGLAIRRDQIRLAIVMVLPVVSYFGWLALIVLQQPGSHA